MQKRHPIHTVPFSVAVLLLTLSVPSLVTGFQMAPGWTAPPRPGRASGIASLSAESWGDYVFRTPQGWRTQDERDRLVLVSPMFRTGEVCAITMYPLRPARTPLPEDAIGTFRQSFRADPLSSYPSPPPTLTSGVSPQGWEYFMIKKLVGGQEGDGKGIGTILLEARIGDQIATIFGTSKDFIVSECFGLIQYDTWPRFFYSLQFNNARSTGQERTAILQQLAGDWFSATASIGLHYTFLPNGRYSDTGLVQRDARISDTQVLRTTQAYFGDGSYTFDGNMMSFTRNDGNRSTHFFRVHQESRDSGRTWTAGLCLLDPSASGEVCYHRR